MRTVEDTGTGWQEATKVLGGAAHQDPVVLPGGLDSVWVAGNAAVHLFKMCNHRLGRPAQGGCREQHQPGLQFVSSMGLNHVRAS